MKLQFAGANNPLYIVRKKEAIMPGDYRKLEDGENVLYEIKADIKPWFQIKFDFPYIMV